MNKDYYVYLHLRQSDNKIFYVGKGKGHRAYVYSSRNYHWTNTYKKHGAYALIYKNNLTEDEAFKLEIELIKKYSDQLVNMTDGGEGTSGLKFSKETKLKLSKLTSGKNNWNYSEKEYEFVKKEEYFKGTQYDFCKKHNLNRAGVSMVCSGKISSHLGWHLKGTLAKIRAKGKENSCFNNKIYKFKNNELNITEQLTQYDFRIKYNLYYSYVSALCRGARKAHKNWVCLNIDTKKTINKKVRDKISKSTMGRKNHNYDYTIRIFKHKDGTIEKCTTNELKVKYDLGPHISSVIKGKFTHHRGWSYLGTL